MPPEAVRTGLVLSGGGARAAYQAGVLRAVLEIVPEAAPSFSVITGVSAGSINGAFLACRADETAAAVGELWELWAALSPEDVFRTDALNLARIGTRWLMGVGLGGVAGRRRPHFLLDTSPLRETLASRLDLGSIPAHVRAGRIAGIALSTTNYRSGGTVTFYDGNPAEAPKLRRYHAMVKSRLTVDHVLASSSIPILFGPVEIGGSYYGDGGIRFATPLSPAIRLGAERILAIGIRHPRPVMAVTRPDEERAQPPSLAELAGVLLNAIFLDGLEMDVERLQRINRNLRLLGQSGAECLLPRSKRIPLLYIRPSRDLGKLAFELYREFPGTLRYLLRGLGASDARGWDFLSYLSFDQVYTLKLLELGYRDGLEHADALRKFFASGHGEPFEDGEVAA